MKSLHATFCLTIAVLLGSVDFHFYCYKICNILKLIHKDTAHLQYMILKKHKEREEILECIHREYEPEWGKMEVRS
jgi:hypothetical protein